MQNKAKITVTAITDDDHFNLEWTLEGFDDNNEVLAIIERFKLDYYGSIKNRSNVVRMDLPIVDLTGE